LRIIQTDKTTILQKITLILNQLIINIFIGLIITLFVMFLIVGILFVLKPHFQQFVLPTIGFVFVLLILAIYLINQIKKYYIYYIITAFVAVILCFIVWKFDRQYDYISEYSEGFAIVRVDKTYIYDIKNYRNGSFFGFINKSGEEITPLEYDIVKPFSEGLAIVGKNSYLTSTIEVGKKYGFIDNTGKEITPIKYDEVKPFSEGFAVVAIGENLGIRKGFSFVAIGSNVEYRGRLYGFIDKSGKEIISLNYNNANSFKNGYAEVSILNKNRDFYGRNFYKIDKNGKVIEYIYSTVHAYDY
jgi:hypothetical protein